MTSPRQRKKRLAFKVLQEKKLAEEQKSSSVKSTERVLSESETVVKTETLVKNLKTKKEESKKETKNALVEMPDKKIGSTVASTDQTVKVENQVVKSITNETKID